VAVSNNKKIEAFHLFCMGVPYDKIALVVGVGSRTIPRWIDTYGWREDKEKLAVIAKENSKNNKEKLNEDLLESVKKVWAKSVRDGYAKASARDLVEVVKLERLVSGLSTENVDVSGSVDGKYELKLVYPDNYERKVKKKE
jgi:hypothetical protein